MSKIVKMYRSEGDVLTRMKSEYVKLGAVTPNTATILVPDKEAELMKRMGQEYVVTGVSAPADVFTALALSVVPASGIPSENPNHDKMVTNQGAATIEKVDETTYKVSADFSKLVSFPSDEASEGDHPWVAVAVATGESTIIGTSYGGAPLTDKDVADATAVGLAAGSFVLWMNMNEGTRTILLGRGGKETTVEILVVDTSK